MALETNSFRLTCGGDEDAGVASGDVILGEFAEVEGEVGLGDSELMGGEGEEDCCCCWEGGTDDGTAEGGL